MSKFYDLFFYYQWDFWPRLSSATRVSSCLVLCLVVPAFFYVPSLRQDRVRNQMFREGWSVESYQDVIWSICSAVWDFPSLQQVTGRTCMCQSLLLSGLRQSNISEGLMLHWMSFMTTNLCNHIRILNCNLKPVLGTLKRMNFNLPPLWWERNRD